ncbi:hypothetical protein LTR85_008690 [Meristemomyces frigidus]|nr:hypothetical protein LTR85_008690 [Meristemomyces frigidus]
MAKQPPEIATDLHRDPPAAVAGPKVSAGRVQKATRNHSKAGVPQTHPPSASTPAEKLVGDGGDGATSPHGLFLKPQDSKDYKELRDLLQKLRNNHDIVRREEGLDEYMREHPESTPSAYHREMYRELADSAVNIGKIEHHFMTIRDRVLRAGGEMLRQGSEAYDLDEFSGDHPEDGTLGCRSLGSKQWLEEQTEKKRPWIEGWLEGVLVDEVPGEDDDASGMKDRVVLLSQESAEGEALAELMPWDSVSQQERRPRARVRIEKYQRQYGHM